MYGASAAFSYVAGALGGGGSSKGKSQARREQKRKEKADKGTENITIIINGSVLSDERKLAQAVGGALINQRRRSPSFGAALAGG